MLCGRGLLKAAGPAVEAAAAALAARAAPVGSGKTWDEERGGKMLIAISPDTTAFWDKSNWWTWRRMPGREWKSDMTPEKGRRCRLQQAIIYWLFNSHAGPLNAKCCQKVCTLFFPSVFKKIFLNNLGSLMLHLMMREISSLHAIASLTEVSKLSESIHEE